MPPRCSQPAGRFSIHVLVQDGGVDGDGHALVRAEGEQTLQAKAVDCRVSHLRAEIVAKDEARAQVGDVAFPGLLFERLGLCRRAR